jgi:hypothetical protein
MRARHEASPSAAALWTYRTIVLATLPRTPQGALGTNPRATRARLHYQ